MPTAPKNTNHLSGSGTSTRAGRSIACLATTIALIAIPAGCASASLASNTGPRPPDRAWSMAARHPVHVGETVQFDFVLTDGFGRFVAPSGVDEYAVLYVGHQRIETDPDPAGHFRFTHRLSRGRPGDTIVARATAHRQRGHRDFINVQGEWLQNSSPYEEPDRPIASDRITLDVYQTRVELTVPRPPLDLELDSGVMRLHRDDGRTTTVYLDRPGRPGFTVTGPEPGGVYTIRYEPDGDEVNPTGVTRVDFSIHDLGGQRHEAATVLDTP